MHKIDGAGHVDGQFVTEDAANGRPPTLVTAEWLNAVQGELVAVLQAAGIAPDKANNAQLSAAIGVLLQRHKQEDDPHPGYLRDGDFENWKSTFSPNKLARTHGKPFQIFTPAYYGGGASSPSGQQHLLAESRSNYHWGHGGFICEVFTQYYSMGYRSALIEAKNGYLNISSLFGDITGLFHKEERIATGLVGGWGDLYDAKLYICPIQYQILTARITYFGNEGFLFADQTHTNARAVKFSFNP